MRNRTYSTLIICLALLSTSLFAAEPAAKVEKSVSVKKGIGLGRFPDWLGLNELKELNVAWF